MDKKIGEAVKPNTHRRRRRLDATVELSRVGVGRRCVLAIKDEMTLREQGESGGD